MIQKVKQYYYINMLILNISVLSTPLTICRVLALQRGIHVSRPHNLFSGCKLRGRVVAGMTRSFIDLIKRIIRFRLCFKFKGMWSTGMYRKWLFSSKI
ncbi:hypothetical protein ACS0TY_018774 [Phlomoides rotata]